jgi:hypothetical protein
LLSWVVSLFLLGLSLVSPLAAPAPAAEAAPALAPAAASVGAGALAVTITHFSPAIPGPNSTLKVRGAVTNTSAAPVTQVRVALRISPTPLYTRSEIDAVLSGNTSREGIRIESTLIELTGELTPGDAAEFSFKLPVAALHLPRPGVYVTGVEALADSGSGVIRQALQRTFLPWWPPKTTAEPVGLTLLWPITGPPERDAKGIYLNEDLAVQMSATGRLSSLVEAGAEHPGLLTWVIDPQVTQAAEDMSHGYTVYVDPAAGTTAPGARVVEARQWFAEVVKAVAADGSHTVTNLYADPDVDAAREGHALGNLLSQRAAAARQLTDTLGTPLPTTLVTPPGGNAAEATLASLAKAGISGLALSATAMPPTTNANFTPSGSAVVPTSAGDLPALLLDPGLSAALAMPAQTQWDAIAMRQRVLAETEVTALELPNSARILSASPAADWSPSESVVRSLLAATEDAPWITPISAAAVLASPDTSVPRTHLALTADQVSAQLPASHVDLVRDNQKSVTQYRAMVTDPDSVPLAFQQAPSRELSAYFRTRPSNRATLAVIVDRQVNAAANSVRVVSSGAITISGESGTIPITVSNMGPEEVTVGLELTSNPPQLFTAEPVEPFDIDSRRRTSVEVKAQVAGSANIPVEIQLVSADGKAIGRPTILIVRSAAYARAARLIVQLSLAVLVLAVLVHGIRRVRRATRKKPGGS